MPPSVREAMELDRAARRLKQAKLPLRFPEPEPTEQATWSWANANDLLNAVEAWTTRGGAITLGLTSDGGALSITLLDGGERYKLYAPNADMLARHLERLQGMG